MFKLFPLTKAFQTKFISIFLQLTVKKNRQSDVVERLKPPVPKRPKLVSRNLQTNEIQGESLKEEKGGYDSNKKREIKIDLQDVEIGVVINDATSSKMEPLSANLGDGDEKEEEVPSINIIHFSKEKELTIPEPPKNAEEKITIEKEGESCEGKEDDEEVISGKEVLCYAWQIAKGMVRNFSTEEYLEQYVIILQITKTYLFLPHANTTSFTVSATRKYMLYI